MKGQIEMEPIRTDREERQKRNQINRNKRDFIEVLKENEMNPSQKNVNEEIMQQQVLEFEEVLSQ